jgi:hypothetical protein
MSWIDGLVGFGIGIAVFCIGFALAFALIARAKPRLPS